MDREAIREARLGGQPTRHLRAAALVIGGAGGASEDARAAMELGHFEAVAAVNDAIAFWPGRIDYAISLHPEKLADWLMRRMPEPPGTEPVVWSDTNAVLQPNVARRPDRTTPDWGGSSGLLAVKVLIEEGFDRIVLAGVPMDAERGHELDPAPWRDAETFRARWIRFRHRIAPVVRSMSGWTAATFGRPTQAWIAGQPEPEPGSIME